jgi:hydrogenase nickel incorporation protein HypA/HybF
MHEFSIVHQIIEIALDAAETHMLETVSCVEVQVGTASGIQPEAMEFAWEAARKDTRLSEARLSITYIPLRMECRECDFQFQAAEIFEPCPACGAPNAGIISGQELRVTSIES